MNLVSRNQQALVHCENIPCMRCETCFLNREYQLFGATAVLCQVCIHDFHFWANAQEEHTDLIRCRASYQAQMASASRDCPDAIQTFGSRMGMLMVSIAELELTMAKKTDEWIRPIIPSREATKTKLAAARARISYARDHEVIRPSNTEADFQDFLSGLQMILDSEDRAKAVLEADGGPATVDVGHVCRSTKCVCHIGDEQVCPQCPTNARYCADGTCKCACHVFETDPCILCVSSDQA